MSMFARMTTLLFLFFSPHLSAGAKPTVWSLESSKGNIILLGSIHVGDSNFYPFASEIEQAFDSASALVVELDISALDPVEVAGVMRTQGMFDAQQLQKGYGLSSVLSADAQLALREFCLGKNKMLCPSKPQMEAMQPWLLALHFAAAMLVNSDFEARFGVDAYFLNQADDKPVVELETFTQQMNAFSTLDTKAQSGFLLQTLTEFNASSEMIDQLVDAWQSGDDERLQALVLQPMASAPEGPAIYEALFLKRNIAMAEKLSNQVRAGETVFVVVGAGHLLGDQGLVSLLRAQGFKASKF